MDRLNELAKTFGDIETRRTMMEEFGDSQFPFTGKNSDGETVNISIASDSIVVDTFQANGWVRTNYYDAEGYDAGEMFDGRWK